MNKAKLVAILNVSPDSFSSDAVLEDQLESRIHQIIQEGADIIDVGAESTAPGSSAISVEEELKRLKLVFEVVRKISVIPDFDPESSNQTAGGSQKGIVNDWIPGQARHDKIIFSIDTTNAQTAKASVAAGFTMVNDVSGGRKDSAMLPFIVESKVSFVMMYCKNISGRADLEDNQIKVFEKITSFFDEQVAQFLNLGGKKEQLILDPGMGAFVSPKLEDSLEILQRIPELNKRYNLPIYIGASRKGFLAKLTKFDFGAQSRLGSSLAIALFAVQQGAAFIRVHDVLATRQALDVQQSIAEYVANC